MTLNITLNGLTLFIALLLVFIILMILFVFLLYIIYYPKVLEARRLADGDALQKYTNIIFAPVSFGIKVISIMVIGYLVGMLF